MRIYSIYLYCFNLTSIRCFAFWMLASMSPVSSYKWISSLQLRLYTLIRSKYFYVTVILCSFIKNDDSTFYILISFLLYKFTFKFLYDLSSRDLLTSRLFKHHSLSASSTFCFIYFWVKLTPKAKQRVLKFYEVRWDCH